MEFLLKTIASPSLSFVHIIFFSYIGAFIGEMQKEVNNEKDVMLSRFLISWISSGFGGLLIGLFLQGTIAQNNKSIVLGGAGAAGHAGYKYSLDLAKKILNNFILSKVSSDSKNNTSNNTMKDNKK